MERYRMKAVLFDTIAECADLKNSLKDAGILYCSILFGIQEEQSLKKAAEELGVELSECLLVTNSRRHAELAERLSIVCVGCVEGLFELPKTATLLEAPEEVSAGYLNLVYCHAKGYPAVVLETERCYLRELTMEDAKELYLLCSAPDVQHDMEEATGTEAEETEKLAAYIQSVYSFFEYGFWGIFEKETGRLIGKAGFKEGSLPLEAGYLLHPSYRGKGIATEVLSALLLYVKEELAVSEVIVKILKENAASLRVAEKCGMQVSKESSDSFFCLSFSDEKQTTAQ